MKLVIKQILVSVLIYLSLFSNISAQSSLFRREEENSETEENSQTQETTELNCSCSNGFNQNLFFRNFPIKAELEWGNNVRTLDLNVRRQDGQSVNKNTRTNFDGNGKYVVNRRNDEKKEVIKLNKIRSGKLLLYVNSGSNQAHISTSGAKISITQCNESVLEFVAPRTNGDTQILNWYIGLFVFDEDKAKFIPINRYDSPRAISDYYDPRPDGPSPGPRPPRGPDTRPERPPRRPETRPERPQINHGGDSNIIRLGSFPLKLLLNWQAPNRDLDFYLRKSDNQQINYSRRSNFNNKAELLNDDRGGNGRQETMKIQRLDNGKYLLFVNNFSRDAHLSRSSATVTILIENNNNQILRMTIPSNNTDNNNVNWVVGMFIFENGNDRFIKINQFATANNINSFFNNIGGTNPNPNPRPNPGPNGGNNHSNPNLLTQFPIKFELSWTPRPRDLDSHMIGPGDHVFYGKRSGFNNKIRLLNDVTTGQGTEVLLVDRFTSGTFNYYVQNYSRDGPLGGSRAIVRMYSGNQLVRTFNVPTVNSNAVKWDVIRLTFDSQGAQFTPINTMDGRAKLRLRK